MGGQEKFPESKSVTTAEWLDHFCGQEIAPPWNWQRSQPCLPQSTQSCQGMAGPFFDTKLACSLPDRLGPNF